MEQSNNNKKLNKLRLRNRKLCIFLTFKDFSDENACLNFAGYCFEQGADMLILDGNGANTGDFICAGKKLRELTSFYNVLFFVNNRIDITKILKADGVTLEPNEIELKDAQKIIEDETIIGIFADNHSQFEQALNNKAELIFADKNLFKHTTDTTFVATKIFSMEDIEKLKNNNINKFLITSFALTNKINNLDLQTINTTIFNN